MTGSCSGHEQQVAFLDARTGEVVRTVKADGYGFFPVDTRSRSAGDSPRFSSPGSTSRPEEKIAAVAVPESVSGFSFSDDARTWATVDDAGKIELKELGSDRVLQRAQLPPGQLPFDLQYHGRYVAILSLDPELREAGPPGWRCGARPVAATGVVVDEEPVPSPRIAIDEGGRRLVTGRGDGSRRGLRHPGRLVDHDVRKAFVGGHRQLVQQRWQADRLGERRRPGHRVGRRKRPVGTHPRGHTAKIFAPGSVRTDERCTPPGSTARRSPGISPARDSSGGRSHSVPWHPRGASSSSRTRPRDRRDEPRR